MSHRHTAIVPTANSDSESETSTIKNLKNFNMEFEEPRKDGKLTELNFRERSINMQVFHITWATFFMCFFGWFSLPPLLSLIKEDLQLSEDQLITTNQASIGATIICRILIGMVCDRFGARRTYAVLLVLGSIPVILVGLVESYVGLLISRLFIGALGASFVITQYHTGQMFAPNVIGLANATSAGWGNFGGGVANAVMPHLANLMVIILPFATPVNAWRFSSVVAGFLLLINGAVYYKFTLDTPLGNVGYKKVDQPEVEMAERETDLEGQREPEDKVEATSPERQPNTIFGKIQAWFSRTSFGPVLQDYRVYILILAYGCCFGVELIMLAQASRYFIVDHGMTKEKAGALVLAFSAMNLFSRSVGGFFSDRLALKGLQYRVYWLGVCLCLEGLSIVLFSFIKELVALIFVIFVFGILTMICEGATFGIVPFVNPQSYGLVAGLTGAGGNTGAVLGLFLFQFGIDWQDSFLYLGIIVISVSLLVFLIRFPKDLEEDGAESKDDKREFENPRTLESASVSANSDHEGDRELGGAEGSRRQERNEGELSRSRSNSGVNLEVEGEY